MLHIAVGDEPAFKLCFKNYGLTPANELLVVRSCMIGPWPLPPDFDFTIRPTGESIQTLPPGGISTWGSNVEGPEGGRVTAEEFEHLRTGIRRFYVFGTATYTDAFNKKRYTNFCLANTHPLIHMLEMLAGNVVIVIMMPLKAARAHTARAYTLSPYFAATCLRAAQHQAQSSAKSNSS